MKTIALSNHKGGCAKTTSAISIATGLARKGYRVLLVDTDPQANATTAVGVDPYTNERSLYGAIFGEYDLPLVPVQVPNDCGGSLHVVPSCIGLASAEIRLVSELNRERQLAELLDGVSDQFDFAIVDCPPSLGMLTINALTAADYILVPIQPHYFAVQGLQQLLDSVAKIKRGLNKKLTIGGVFLTDYDGRTKMHTEAAAAVEQAFPDELFQTRIRHNVALSEASRRGLSIYDYDPRSNGAKDYTALCDEIAARFE